MFEFLYCKQIISPNSENILIFLRLLEKIIVILPIEERYSILKAAFLLCLPVRNMLIN